MKKVIVAFSILFFAFTSNAQPFWTESFGTGCNRGQLAATFSSTNGAWTVSTTGTNDTYANTWFVSSACAGTGIGNCSSDCITSSIIDPTLHVGNIALFVPTFVNVGADTGANYFSGGFCGVGYCATTNTRAQSPVINCSGRTNIMVNFIYLENGDAANDDASFCFSSDGGLTWSTINALAKTGGTCSTGGQWTAISIFLPVSADNNASVKIGFNWTNNDDGIGTDPSFAVYEIAIYDNPTNVTLLSDAEISVFSKDNGAIQVNTNGQAYKVLGIYNVLGQDSKFTQTNNTLQLGETTSGIYIVNLEVNGVRVVRKVLVN